MTEHNKRVLETLNRYVNLENIKSVAPHYALMVSGEWGCGKTYFIRELWLKNNTNSKINCVYVSLFGIKSTFMLNEEIASAIIFNKQMVKESKLKRLAEKMSALSEGLLKNKIGIGWDSISSIIARDWLEKDKEEVTKVLILDDLERVEMDIKEVFGFVSNFIESTNLRVIFICNENEISNENSIHDFENYNRIREKLIGDTLCLNTDIDDALEKFLLEIHYVGNEKDIVRTIIKDVRTKLHFENLRIIRHTLIKLKPLLEIIKDSNAYKNYEYSEIEILGKEYNKEEYLYAVAEFFIVANMQKVIGDIKEGEEKLAFSSYKRSETTAKAIKEKDKEEQKKQGREGSGYLLLSYIDGWGTYIPLDDDKHFWEHFIWESELEKSYIINMIENDFEILIPTKHKKQDVLFLLNTRYWAYSKSEFNSMISILVDSLLKGIYKDLIEIAVAYALLARFSHYEILENNLNVECIFTSVLEITDLFVEENNEDYNYSTGLDLSHLSYKGYGVETTLIDEKLHAFVKKMMFVAREKKNIKIKEDIIILVDKIITFKSDPNAFFNELRWRSNFDACNLYIDVPVLKWIGEERLWKLLDSIDLFEQRRFFSSLSSRYSDKILRDNTPYIEEKGILENLFAGYTQRYYEAKSTFDNKLIVYELLVKDAERLLNLYMEKYCVKEE